jgi:hypothetical protein
MARFDRQDTEASLSGSLDAATDQLESFVKDEVGKIIDAALERASEIEREAAERAQAVKREAERKSEEMLEEAFTRAWRILDGIDLMESGVGDMIGALRVEMEGLAADLGSATPAGRRGLEDPEPSASRPSAALYSAPGDDPAGGHDNGTGSSDGNYVEVEQMIIEQVSILRREGRSREDAEHFVMRFKQGKDYLHVLDRIYADDSEGPTPGALSSRPQRVRWGFRARRG